MADLVILTDEKLRELAKIIHNQEADAITSIKFKSEAELVKYLSDSKANYESVVGLLDDGGELQRKFQDNTRAPIADDISSYIVYCANSALQTVRNYTLRMNYLNKISGHAKSLINALQELDPENVTNVARLANEAVQYRNAMLEYTRKYRSTASSSFSQQLKDSGITLEELVQRYQAKLGFVRPFKDLEEEQKLQVYEEIIEASGRGRVIVTQLSEASVRGRVTGNEYLSKASGVGGTAVLLFNAGTMVWDIFSSGHAFQAATHDAVKYAASKVGGALVGEVVEAALSTELVGLEATSFFVVTAGLVTSIAGAFILGVFAGWLVDLIFASGGTHFSTEGLRCYVAPMPDGEVLARQIAHLDAN